MKGRNQINPSWDQYVADITGRFGEPFDDPMAELMELKQTTSVKDYHDEFDSIISRLQLSPEYTLSCFITGLKEELRSLVRMFNPSTIAQAYSLAKIQELNLSKTSNKPTTKFNNTPSLTSTKPGILPTPLKNSNIPPKPITAPFKPNPN